MTDHGTVRPRHRQDEATGMATAQVQAALKQARCVELVTAGYPYEQVARQVGYAHKGSVSKAVWRALSERTVDAVDAG